VIICFSLVFAGLRTRFINESLLSLMFAGLRPRFINELLFVLVLFAGLRVRFLKTDHCLALIERLFAVGKIG